MDDMRTIDVEMRLRSESERIVEGRIVPYGETVTVWGQDERFARGAVAGIEPDTIIFKYEHGDTIGRGIELTEHDDGAYAAFRVANTPRGDEVLTLAAERVVRSFSVGFIPTESADVDGVTEYRRVRLLEVSAVALPAYAGATINQVRNQEGTRNMGNENTTEETTDRDAAAEIADMIERTTSELAERLSTLEMDAGTRTAPPAPVDQRKAGAEWLRMQAATLVVGEERALADVTGTLAGTTGADGVIAEKYIPSQFVDDLRAVRPFFTALGSFPMPRSGYARIPVTETHTKVAKRTGQKHDANTRALKIVPKSFEAEWFDGAVDVALEWIMTADPEGLAIVWADLADQYAAATEAGAIATVEGAAGIVKSGAALPVDSYKNFAKAVATQAMAVRKATRAPAEFLAVPEALWPDIIGMVDANDRRQFATDGRTNSDAGVGYTAESFALPGGITVFYADVTNAMLSNRRAIRAADGGITRVQATNVAKMGQDVGVLGRTMVVPRIPAGIITFATTP